MSFSIEQDNQKREFSGLIEAVKKINASSGLILTHNQEDSFDVDGVKIVVKPVWKWLLL